MAACELGDPRQFGENQGQALLTSIDCELELAKHYVMEVDDRMTYHSRSHR